MKMKEILLVVSLACTMALVESDCFFASPCEVASVSRVSCGSSGISKSACLWLNCCYDEATDTCFEKVSICEARNADLATSCPRPALASRSPCLLASGETCGIGILLENWDCEHNSGVTTVFQVIRCCCDTPCSGVNRCGIPPADRKACVEGTVHITTQAECFAAHCCFEDTAAIPCFEPNIPPEATCDMVFPGCETP